MSNIEEKKINLEKHLNETNRIWESFNKGKPIRVPMLIGATTRYFIFNNFANPEGLSFEEYLNSPKKMFNFQMKFNDWARENIICDRISVFSYDKNEYNVYVEFQNLAEASWFGCPIEYREGYEPYVSPSLTDENKNEIFNKTTLEFDSGIMGKAKKYYEKFLEYADKYPDKEVNININNPTVLSMEGPMTTACSIRGTTQFCMDMINDRKYALKLLDYITEATINRILKWREYYGMELKPENFSFADDSIELISCEMYKDMVLSFHKRICSALSEKDSNRSIHLCGDAQRHFPIIKKELNVMSFDTGFPIDFTKLRKELGPKVTISGGVEVEFLKSASPYEVKKKVKNILESGIMEGGKFILREANNLAPYTPIENIDAMYEACREYGKYDK